MPQSKSAAYILCYDHFVNANDLISKSLPGRNAKETFTLPLMPSSGKLRRQYSVSPSVLNSHRIRFVSAPSSRIR